VTKMNCDDSVCRRGMKCGTEVGVHKTNYATEGFPEIRGGRGSRGEMQFHSLDGAGASAITVPSVVASRN